MLIANYKINMFLISQIHRDYQNHKLRELMCSTWSQEILRIIFTHSTWRVLFPRVIDMKVNVTFFWVYSKWQEAWSSKNHESLAKFPVQFVRPWIHLVWGCILSFADSVAYITKVVTRRNVLLISLTEKYLFVIAFFEN